MDFSALDTTTLVASGLLVLGFLIGCSRGRATWLLCDFLATITFGLVWFFLPHIILGYQVNGEVDGIHLTLCRAFAATMIGDAVKRYFCRTSKDTSTQVMLLLARIVGCLILLLSMIYAQNVDKSVWNDQHIFFGMLGNLLYMAGSVVYYALSRFSGGHAQLESRLNFHLRMDAIILLAVGCTSYAFPDAYLKFLTNLTSFDAAHLHMMRATGAYIIGSAILSFLAPGFLFDWDKRAVLAGRTVKVFATVVAVMYASVKYESEWGNNTIWYLLLECLIALNAMLGYYAPHETDMYKTK